MAKRESQTRPGYFSDDKTSFSPMFRNCMSQEEKKEAKKQALQFCECKKNWKFQQTNIYANAPPPAPESRWFQIPFYLKRTR